MDVDLLKLLDDDPQYMRQFGDPEYPRPCGYVNTVKSNGADAVTGAPTNVNAVKSNNTDSVISRAPSTQSLLRLWDDGYGPGAGALCIVTDGMNQDKIFLDEGHPDWNGRRINIFEEEAGAEVDSKVKAIYTFGMTPMSTLDFTDPFDLSWSDPRYPKTGCARPRGGYMKPFPDLRDNTFELLVPPDMRKACIESNIEPMLPDSTDDMWPDPSEGAELFIKHTVKKIVAKRCRYYVGITRNPPKRLSQHNKSGFSKMYLIFVGQNERTISLFYFVMIENSIANQST